MEDVVRVVISWIAAVLAPGFAITLAIVPSLRRRPLELLAAAPAAGIGATFAAAEACMLAGIPFAPWVTAALVVAGGVVAAFRIRAEPSPRDEPPADDRPPRAVQAGALLLLAAGVAIGIGFWAVGIKASAQVPPNRDGGHHGFYVSRIANEETVDTDEVVISDPITKEQYGYYPLGLHASAAIGHRISDASVSDVLTGWVILFAATVYPLGMFVLARRLAPDRPLLPGFVALATPFFGMFPYKWILWGGLTQLVSLTLVPVAIALVLDSAERRASGSAVLAGLAVFGTMCVFLSQALLIALVAGILIAGRWVERSGRSHIPAQLRALSLSVGVAAVLILPTLAGAIGGVSDRSPISEPNDLPISDAVGRVFTGGVFAPAQASLYVIVLVGFGVAMYQRRYVAWAIATAAVFVIFFASATPGLDALRGLSSPWYESYDRTSGNTVPFVTLFAGIALDAIATWLALRIRARDRRNVPPSHAIVLSCATAVAAVFIAFTFQQARKSAVDTVRRAYDDNPTQQGDLDAMAALAKLDRTGAAVLNQEMDGSIWMAADFGLRPLFTQGLLGSKTASASTQDRVWLAQHIHEYGSNPRVAELLAQYGIGYVYVNELTYLGEPAWIDLARVEANPRLHEVIHRGTSHVFEVVR